MRYITIGIIGLLAGILLAACGTPASEQATDNQTARTILVYQSPTCGCCNNWVSYMEEQGYTVTVEEVMDLTAIKAEHQVPTNFQSCHTALIDGYVIEGHVPAADIERLLTERPAVVGIGVPGSSISAPGMEIEGAAPQPFDVIMFDETGTTEVFSSYNQ
jgi:hypothetical protein